MQFSRIRMPRIRFFPIFYSGTFTLFAFLLLAMLLVSPGDFIYQSMKAGELYRIIVVGGVYVLTFVIALFIYAARLFSTRSALANIPREWDFGGNETENVGLGLGMSRKMGKLVREGWAKSAIVTYESTPRELKGRSQTTHAISRAQCGQRGQVHTEAETSKPLWGTVRHAGWSDPECPDLPNLHFESVVTELPNLLEAKVVSVRPPLPGHESVNGDESPVDLTILELLRRPLHMGLRDYVKHLISLEILGHNLPNYQEFLDIYERARFSGIPLEDEEFRHLMSIFLDILQEVDGVHERTIARLVAGSRNALNSRQPSIDSEGTARHYKSQRQSSSDSASSQSEAQATAYTAPSRYRYSQSLSDSGGPSTSVSGSDQAYETQIETMETRSQLGSISADSSSLASSGGSVIRAGPPSAQLNIPLVHHEHHEL